MQHETTISEAKIIEAARNVFHRKGFDGARMQEIADEAGINKAMLHYYFRSKDQLFEAVFKEALGRIFPMLLSVLMSDETVEQNLMKFIPTYIETIKQHPYLPGFVLHEMTRNPERLTNMVRSVGVASAPPKILQQLQKGMDEGRYITIAPEQILVSVLAACIFPFVAKPMVKVALGMDDEKFDQFINQRKEQLPEFILNGIKKK
ncbi:TetR/AcrR family transcriptional regulator [bacterium]|nr:TetR/AcrR family transcriptional regulator [bacterium]